MSKTVTVKLIAGSNISITLDLYEKVGGIDTLLVNNISKVLLTSSLGYIVNNVNDNATHIIVKDEGSCGNSLDIPITGEPINDLMLINDEGDNLELNNEGDNLII